MGHVALTEALWLVKNGVPFDVAFSLDEAERLGWSIIFGQFEGGEWDWNSRSWRRKDA